VTFARASSSGAHRVGAGVGRGLGAGVGRGVGAKTGAAVGFPGTIVGKGVGRGLGAGVGGTPVSTSSVGSSSDSSRPPAAGDEHRFFA
jgi:hypothetical protein